MTCRPTAQRMSCVTHWSVKQTQLRATRREYRTCWHHGNRHIALVSAVSPIGNTRHPSILYMLRIGRVARGLPGNELVVQAVIRNLRRMFVRSVVNHGPGCGGRNTLLTAHDFRWKESWSETHGFLRSHGRPLFKLKTKAREQCYSRSLSRGVDSAGDHTEVIQMSRYSLRCCQGIGAGDEAQALGPVALLPAWREVGRQPDSTIEAILWPSQEHNTV